MVYIKAKEQKSNFDIKSVRSKDGPQDVLLW